MPEIGSRERCLGGVVEEMGSRERCLGGVPEIGSLTTGLGDVRLAGEKRPFPFPALLGGVLAHLSPSGELPTDRGEHCGDGDSCSCLPPIDGDLGRSPSQSRDLGCCEGVPATLPLAEGDLPFSSASCASTELPRAILISFS